MITTLPIIDCNDCGLCCSQLVYPPFYGPDDPSFAALERDRPDLAEQLAIDREDRHRRFQAGDMTADWGVPCSWLDPATKLCRNYDHRPDICRDFELGGEDCLRIRQGE